MKLLVKRIFSLALLAAVAAAPTALAVNSTGMDGPVPVPNNQCPQNNPPINAPGGVPIIGCGVTLEFAVANALGGASGVICDLCAGGDQCARLVNTSNGSTFIGVVRAVIVSGIPLVCISGTFTGSYDVDCASC